MGRPKQYDRGQVLHSATQAFVRHGYEGVSVDQLVEATGVHRASLYAAFGSKHGLFLACLDAIAEPTSTQSLDLTLIALVERASHDDAVRKRVSAILRSMPREADRVLGERLLIRAGITSLQEAT